MADQATPNLPSRDFDATEQFYGTLDFGRRYRDPGWLILERGALILEFFPYPDLDPATSSFSCCLRLDDLDGFHAVCTRAGIVAAPRGFPRLTTPKVEASGVRIAYLLDPDGTLLRLVENPTEGTR